MTKDQLEHAASVFRAMNEHKKMSESITADSDHWCNVPFPAEILEMHAQQKRDWHKLRAYELAEEFAKL